MPLEPEEKVRRWMKDKENEFPDPNSIFSIEELQETNFVPERHEKVTYNRAWKLTCRFKDTDMGYDETKPVYVLEDGNGNFHSSSDDYGNNNSAVYYGEYGL